MTTHQLTLINGEQYAVPVNPIPYNPYDSKWIEWEAQDHPPIIWIGPFTEGALVEESRIELMWQLKTITGEWVRCLIQKPSDDDRIKTRQVATLKEVTKEERI